MSRITSPLIVQKIEGSHKLKESRWRVPVEQYRDFLQANTTTTAHYLQGQLTKATMQRRISRASLSFAGVSYPVATLVHA